MDRRVSASVCSTLRGLRTWHVGTLLAREPGDLLLGRLSCFRAVRIGKARRTQIFPWVGKPGYNLTTDLADEAIKYMQELNAAAPDKPFFLYYVPGGTHARTSRPRSGSRNSRANSTWAGTLCASRSTLTRNGSE